MAGGRVVGEVSYRVTAEDDTAAGFASAEAKADAFERAMEAKKARIEVEADLKGLEKDLAEAKAMAEALDGEKIQFEAEVKNLKELHRLGELTDEQSKRFDDLNKSERQYLATQKRRGQADEQQLRRLDELRRKNLSGASMEEALRHEMEQTTAANRVNQRVLQQDITTRRNRVNSLKAEEQAMSRMAKVEGDRALTVARLEERYAKLHTQIQKTDELDRGRSERENIIIRRLEAEKNAVENNLRAMGHSDDQIRNLNRDLRDSESSFNKWGRSILGTRLHLGFFSTTIGGLSRLLVVLGPVVLAVAGALGSLVGVAGAGIAGAFAVGTAALGGFGLAAIGSYIALKPVVHQMGQAYTASKHLGDQIQKYGKNSSQAKDAQTQLNNSIKGLPKPAQQAFRSLSQMHGEFDKIAGKSIRQDFFGSFAQAIQTMKADLPAFAAGTRDVFHSVSQGFDDWMKGLRGAEAQHILSDLFKGAADSAQPLMAGLGHIGTAIARIAQAGAHFLPGLSHGFEQWAQSIEDGLGQGDSLTQRVGRWVTAMQKVGHFAQAAGSALTTFFGIGVGPGEGFLDSMTRSLDRWNAAMKANPQGTRTFFQNAVNLIRQLGPALGKALMTLANLSEAFSPAIEAAASALNVLAGGLEFISSIPIVGWFAQATVAGLLFTKMIRSLAAFSGVSAILKMFGIGGAGRGIAGGIGAGAEGAAGGGLMARLFGRGGAAGATRQLALFGAEAEGTLALMAPWAAGALAVGVGVGLLTKALIHEDDNLGQSNAALRAFNSSTVALPAAQKAAAAGTRKAADALAHYNKQVKQGKASAKDQHDAAVQIADGQNQAADQGAKVRFEMEKQQKAVKDLNDAYQDQLKVVNNLHKGPRGETPQTLQAEQDKLKAIAENARIANLNFHRLQQGADLASKGMLASLGTIKRVAGRQTALKFRFDDESVVRGVSRLSSRLSGVGKKQAVIKILADSKNADQAIIRLQRLMGHLPLQKRVLLQAQDQATSKADAIRIAISRLHDKLITARANDAASSKIRAIEAAIAALHDKSVTITTTHVDRTVRATGSRPAGATAPGSHATGGVAQPFAPGGAWDRMMQRAYNQAEGRQGLNSRAGARLTQARYIAGEQRKYNEFIITEDPAYRQSNLRYLQRAAQSLNVNVVPGYARGHHRRRHHGGGTVDPGASGIDTSAYDALHTQLADWSSEYDLDRREYDLYSGTHAGATLGDLINDLNQQKNIYGQLVPVLDSMIKAKGRDPVDIPKQVRKNAKKDYKDKSKKQDAQKVLSSWEARQQAAQDYNQSIKDGRGDWADELHQIPFLMRGLDLDIAELQNAASTGTLLGTSSANLANFNVMRSFASNITGASAVPSLGAFGLSSSLTTPPIVAAGASGSAPGVRSTAPASSGGVTVNNTFTEAPSDPLQWSAGVAFELGAMGV